MNKMAANTSGETTTGTNAVDSSGKNCATLLQREFVNIGNGEGEAIRVMQWNMLAQAMSGGEDNFIKCPPDAVKWENRKDQLLQEILQFKPTVLCMEEVDVFEFLLESLSKHGYLGVFYPKPQSPCLEYEVNTGPDGCAIFYDTKKMALLESKNAILRDETGMPSNQVCIIAHLQTKSTNQKDLVVAVTHLKSKRGFKALREVQGKGLVKNISETFPDGPFIVCGDFNADPEEAVYKVMTSSNLDLQSVYTYLSPEKAEPKYTTVKVRPAGKESHTIDYIWCSRKGLKVNSVLKLPTEEEIGENGLPSWSYPSDHLSLVADIGL